MALNEKLYSELAEEFLSLSKKNQESMDRFMLLGQECIETLRARVSEADLVYIEHLFYYEDHIVKLKWVSILTFFISVINI